MSTSSEETLWDLKARVEADFPHFPSIDVTSPTFSHTEYYDQVTALFVALGIPYEELTISWHNLSSTVPVEAPDDSIKTVVSAFDGIAHLIKHGGRKARHLHFHHHASAQSTASLKIDPAEKVPKTAQVLSNLDGVLEPGQMCLVLGPSGSGSSLFLSRLAGRPIGSQIDSTGEVLYNGKPLLHNIVEPTHFVQYVGQHDDHIPQITVRHTLEFAAQCKWPEWFPHVEVIRRNDILMISKMLRIERTLDTIVGSEILRGVSGGERKRITIAEMLIGMNAGGIVMDNWSKGLDSSTTLSITQTMREFATETRRPVITFMQAPGVDAFKLFDTVLVLDRGHPIYYGPREQAEGWFLSLGFHRPPQRSVPDFIATVANPELRNEYLPSHKEQSELEHSAPRTSEEFAARFAESDIAAKMNAHTQEILSRQNSEPFDIPEALTNAAQNHSLQKPRHQIKAIGKRQVRFYGATRSAVVADLMQNFILGVILGSIFWQLPDNSGGASSRAGIVFLGLLFMGLSSLAKVDEKHQAKAVFAKQRASSFYNAWPYIMTMAFFDIVMELMRTICFIVPLYLMAGLNIGSSGQRLLYAVLIVLLLSLIMISMTRTLVAIFDDSESAQGIGGLLTIFLVLFAGFMKPPDDIQAWLIWIYWMDPIHYVFEALVLNEYDGLTFKCDIEELIPVNSALPAEPPFRLCLVNSGVNYLENNLGITNDKIFRLYHFLILLGYLVLFFSFSAIATALVKARGHALKWRTVNGSVKLEEEPDLDATVVDINPAPSLSKSRARFTFSNVEYAVANGKKLLLNGVSGHALGGKVVLLMGESGAGKSTLLDVCALRKTMKKDTSMKGDIRLNGHAMTQKIISHFTGYCEQTDMHIGEATVKEAVIFSAKLRLPASIPVQAKKVKAMETLELLDLTSYSDMLVKSLGSGELKLLTMALEVVAEPMVLFLDEPTSGISASSALVVANALRKIADTGTCVICTVHQPSTEVFGMFDQLLLLKRGGYQVYFGDIGDRGVTLRSYFESRGAIKMPEDANPADWVLDVIADESIDFAHEWEKSSEKAATEQETNKLAEADSESSDIITESFQSVKRLAQLREVIRRQFWRYWRLPEYNFTRALMMFAIAFLIGLLYLREIDNTQGGANLAFAALFLTVIPSSLYAQNVIPPTAQGRAVFYREVASGTYTPFSFHLALGLVEVPFTAVATTVFTVVFYFMVGLDPSRFFYFFLAAQLLYFFSVMLGVVLASITPNPALALMIASSVTSVFNVLSGFFIRKNDMPVWWRWSTWINPFAYYLSGIVQNQMEGQVFTCTPDELLRFQLPQSFPTCEDIPGGDYVTTVIEGVQSCEFCPIPNGDVLIKQFGADAVNKWVSIVALLVAIFICRIVSGFGFSKLRFLSR